VAKFTIDSFVARSHVRVRWSSQAGCRELKEGLVVAIIPAGTRPEYKRFIDIWRRGACGFVRSEASYVVRVGNQHYWPLTSALQLDAVMSAWLSRKRALPVRASAK
jgi:hypothetical protein